MRGYLDLPLRTKLLLVGLIASSAAVGLACAAFIINDRATFREHTLRRLAAQADIIAQNVAPAVVFADPEAATRTLGALAAEPSIVAASVMTIDGATFADYLRKMGSPPPQPLPVDAGGRSHAFSSTAVTFSQQVQVEGRPVGVLTIQSDLQEIQERIKRTMALGVGVFALSLVVALAIATPLARTLSRPILSLASLARRVSDQKDYSLRAPVEGRDEIGELVQSVNNMLSEIQSRDAALETARAQLEERNRDLARSNADLEQFAYVASHDLQEPLRMVAGYTGLLEEEYGDKLDDSAREYIGYAVSGTTRMHALIQDLLAYARVGSSQEGVQVASCERILADVLQDLQAACIETGTVVTHDPLPDLRADPSQIRQLLQNLLTNAMKFRGAEPPRIHVGARQQGDWWEMSVRDNGIGIDPRHADKIFVIFQRLHSREAYPGTGIGLAICKKIVERAGGSIRVESAPGQGTTFFFTLPGAR